MSKKAPVSFLLVKLTFKYYLKNKRWMALLRAMINTIVFRYGGELCQECGRTYKLGNTYWHAPDPLWMELMGKYGGLLCPSCFSDKACDSGYLLCWTPVVTFANGVATSNHWADPTRDRLLIGFPDPNYFIDEKVNDPQPPWGIVCDALGWDFVSYYPEENRKN